MGLRPDDDQRNNDDVCLACLAKAEEVAQIRQLRHPPPMENREKGDGPPVQRTLPVQARKGLMNLLVPEMRHGDQTTH